MQILRLSRNKKPIPLAVLSAWLPRLARFLTGVRGKQKRTYPHRCPTTSAILLSSLGRTQRTGSNNSKSALMTPTSQQVDEISEVLALLMEEFLTDSNAVQEVDVTQGEEEVSEEVLAQILAKSLSARDGEPELRGLLAGARGLLRVSLEVL
jgi:hypothetical protein